MEDEMWNACRLAMQIDQDTGSLPLSYKENAAYKKSGFISDVYSYSGGLGNINAGVVGAINEGVMIAFRGTSGGWDWVQNIVGAVQIDFLSDQGKVHAGFYNAISSIFKDIKSKAVKLLSESTCSNPSLYLTGHSKGGAMGILAAKLFKHSNIDVTAVYTFGAPRVGDSVFKSNYHIETNRYEAFLDIVPHLPFTDQEKIFLPRANTIYDIGYKLAKDIPGLQTIIDLLVEKPSYCSVGERICIKKTHGKYGNIPSDTNNAAGETLNSLCAIDPIIRNRDWDLLGKIHNDDYYDNETEEKIKVRNETGNTIKVSIDQWGTDGDTSFCEIKNHESENWNRSGDRGFVMYLSESGTFDGPYYVRAGQTITINTSVEGAIKIEG